MEESLEEESVNLNVENERDRQSSASFASAAAARLANRKARFSNNRSKSADHPTAGGAVNSGANEGRIAATRRRLSNQYSLEMAKRCRCSEDVDVVDDAVVRNEDLDEIQVHVANSRSFGLSSSFLRRKKDEYEGKYFDFREFEDLKLCISNV